MSDANALKDQGNKAFAAKNYDEAIRLFSEAIAIDPNNHVLYSNRSAAKAGKKLWAEALEDAEQTIRVNPVWSKGFARKGAALHGARRFGEAIAAYEAGLALEGDKPSPALLKGLKEVQEARKADDDNDAGGGIGKMFQDPSMFAKLAANPRTAPLLADQSFVQQLRFLQTNPSAAGNAFNDPRMIQVMGVLMGIDMQGFTRPEGSNEMPDGIFENTPTSPTASSSSKPAPTPKQEDIVMEEPEEEDEDAKAEAAAKAEATSEKQLGSNAYKARDFAAAEQHFSKAWDTWPKDITYLTNLAAVYFEQGEYTKTIETCEKAVEQGRELRADYKLVAKAFGRIGSAYAKLGDLDSAIKFYSKSLAEHRTPDILNKIRETEKQKKEADIKAYINPELSAEAREEGNKLFKAADFAGSVKAYTEAIKRDPADPRAYNNRAAAYTKLVALPEALKDADEAIKIDPKFVKAHIRKSLVLFSMRDYSKAMEAAQRASDADEEKKHGHEIEQQMQKIAIAMQSQREGESEEETLQRAMRDPEVAGIMNDPVVQQILQQAQQDPKALQDHMKNPMIKSKIEKLIAAGIIRTR